MRLICVSSYVSPGAFSSPLRQRVEDQARQELRIKVRALGRHLLELARRSLRRVRCGPAARGRPAGTIWRRGLRSPLSSRCTYLNCGSLCGNRRLSRWSMHQLVQQADAQFPPGVALIGSQSRHRRGIGDAGEEPAAVGGRAEAEDVLSSVPLDAQPRLLGRFVPGSHRFDREVARNGVGQFARRQGPASPDTSRCVGKMARPGSLMPTSIISTKFDGSDSPRYCPCSLSQLR